MLNSLGIASDGYLKSATKHLLVIAVAGYLNFGVVPPTPQHNTYIVQTDRGGSGEKEKREKLELEHRLIVERDDNEILDALKIFLQCQQ